MGYLSDWKEAEEAAAAAHATCPDCDGTLDCPAAEHLLDCRRFRAERRAKATLRAYGRWCEKCQRFVGGGHRREMLQIPHRQVGHEPITLYIKADTSDGSMTWPHARIGPDGSLKSGPPAADR